MKNRKSKSVCYFTWHICRMRMTSWNDFSSNDEDVVILHIRVLHMTHLHSASHLIRVNIWILYITTCGDGHLTHTILHITLLQIHITTFVSLQIRITTFAYEHLHIHIPTFAYENTYEYLTSPHTHMNASHHTFQCDTSHIWIRHVTHMDALHDL